MRFEHAEWIWIALIATAIGAALVYLWSRRRRRAVSALGSAGMLERLTPVDLSGAAPRRAGLIAGALGILGLALAGPQWGAQQFEEQTRALSVVIVADVSESMWAQDLQPSRLERQRLAARRLVSELEGHRVGLVAFAGEGYRLSPLTVDLGAIHLYLDVLDPTIAGTPGSSLTAAITAAMELLREDRAEGGERAIVVLTDGEAHEPEDAALEAARRATALNARIYGIGIGGEQGEPIPLHDRAGDRIAGYKRDSNGQVVLSRLTREPLASAARLTGGFWAAVDQGAVPRVLEALNELERGRGTTTAGVRWIPRFQWFVAVGLFLLALDWVWAWRRVR